MKIFNKNFFKKPLVLPKGLVEVYEIFIKNSELIFGVSTIIVSLFLLIFTIYFALQLKPAVPIGNDPITHLEYVESLKNNLKESILLSVYPLLFHLLLLWASKISHFPPMTIFTYLQFFMPLLIIFISALLAKFLFNNKVAYLALCFSLLFADCFFYTTSLGILPDLLANNLLLIILLMMTIYWINKKSFSRQKTLFIGVALLFLSFFHGASIYLAVIYFLSLFLAYIEEKNFANKKNLLFLITLLIIAAGVSFIASSSLHYRTIFKTKKNTDLYSPDEVMVNLVPAFLKIPKEIEKMDLKGCPIDSLLSFDLSLFLAFAFLFFFILVFPLKKKLQKERVSLFFLYFLVIGSFFISQLPFNLISKRIITEFFPIYIIFIAASFFYFLRVPKNYFKPLAVVFLLTFFITNKDISLYNLHTFAPSFIENKNFYLKGAELLKENSKTQEKILVFPYKNYFQFLINDREVLGISRNPIDTKKEEFFDFFISSFTSSKFQKEQVTGFKEALEAKKPTLLAFMLFNLTEDHRLERELIQNMGLKNLCAEGKYSLFFGKEKVLFFCRLSVY